MFALFVRVHDREGVSETLAGTREGYGARDQGELRRLRRRQVFRGRPQQAYAKASRRPILLLRYLHLSHCAIEEGIVNVRSTGP